MITSLLIILILILIMLLCQNKKQDDFMCNDADPELLRKSNIKTKEILNSDDYKISQELKMTNKIWNNNNTLDSKDCTTCNSAPNWWYPKDAYDPEKFKEVWHSDKYDPSYNIEGDARRFWQFNSY